MAEDMTRENSKSIDSIVLIKNPELLAQAMISNPDTFREAMNILKTGHPELYAEIAPPHIDQQTSLFSKKYFEDTLLDKAIEQAKKGGLALCYGLFDIDDFKKEFNSKYSWLAGDRAIEHVSHSLKKGLRTGKEIIVHEKRNNLESFDIIGRIPKETDTNPDVGRVGGGEEFASIFYKTPLKYACLAMDRTKKRICEGSFSTDYGSLKVTVSGGVAQLTPDMGKKDLITESQRALSTAKATGKNKICYVEGGKIHEYNPQ